MPKKIINIFLEVYDEFRTPHNFLKGKFCINAFYTEKHIYTPSCFWQTW
jgi:hypothetical protein